MNVKKILDCTLRDGGYVNNWEFRENEASNIIRALLQAKIDLVECGYLSQNSGEDKDSTLFPSVKALEFFLQRSGFGEEKERFVCMINLGEMPLEELPLYVEGESLLWGIRLAFHKDKIEEAFDASRQIQEKGYRLFVQPMVIESYTDKEVVDLLELFNNIAPYAVYIVDSFGSMLKEDFKRIYHLFHHNLSLDSVLGYHAHNNLQLAYGNGIEFMDMCQDHDRTAILDSSVFGMGRGAGNLNTELLADFSNQTHHSDYEIEPLLEVIDDCLEFIHREHYWGFSVAHFLSARHGCHPSYATFYTAKKNLAVTSINKLLGSIQSERKDNFDSDYAEQCYIEFKASISFKENFDSHIWEEREILLVASGNSVVREKKRLLEFISFHKPSVVAVNHMPDIFSDYLFFSNQKRYNEFAKQIDESRLILTSNVRCLPEHKGCMVVGYERLVNGLSTHSDNAAVLLLSLAVEQGVSVVNLAGLDGYDSTQENFSYRESARVLDVDYMNHQNEVIAQSMEELSHKVRMFFVTPSRFQTNLPLRIVGIIPARYKSSRFPGKPLAMIGGIPMIERTYHQARLSEKIEELVVATDDKRIEAFCFDREIPVVMTSSDCLTGTDRIAEVAARISADLYVNIQGDEPVIDPVAIDQIVDAFCCYGDDYMVYNLYKEVEGDDEITSDSIIKVIVNEKDELVYMSRLGVPFDKSGQQPTHNKQVCVYGFTRQALELFASREKTINERHEDVEILRFIDMGYKVKMLPTQCSSIAVDNPEDVKKVELYLRSEV